MVFQWRPNRATKSILKLASFTLFTVEPQHEGEEGEDICVVTALPLRDKLIPPTLPLSQISENVTHDNIEALLNQILLTSLHKTLVCDCTDNQTTR
jgi:hypothetical protein